MKTGSSWQHVYKIGLPGMKHENHPLSSSRNIREIIGDGYSLLEVFPLM